MRQRIQTHLLSQIFNSEHIVIVWKKPAESIRRMECIDMSHTSCRLSSDSSRVGNSSRPRRIPSATWSSWSRSSSLRRRDGSLFLNQFHGIQFQFVLQNLIRVLGHRRREERGPFDNGERGSFADNFGSLGGSTFVCRTSGTINERSGMEIRERAEHGS